MVAVSILMTPVVWDGEGEGEEMRARLAAMKSGLRSTAVMCIKGWDVRVGERRHWVVRTRGPQALSRIRRGWVGGRG